MNNNIFSQLFAELSSEYSFYIITWLLGAFLIGWIARYFASRAKARKLEESLERSKLELKQSKKLKDGLQEKLDLKEADYRKISLSLTDKNKLVKDLEGEKRTLNGKLQATLDDYEKAKAEYTQTSLRLEELNDQILGLRTKNAQLNDELQQSTDTINQYANTQGLGNKLGELEEVIAQLRAENASLKATVQTDTPSMESYEALELKIAELEAQKEQLNIALAEITQLEEGNTVLNATVMRLLKNNESLQYQAEELIQYEYGNDILNATIVNLIAENQVLEEKILAAGTTSKTIIEEEPMPAEAASESIIIEELTTEQAKAEVRAAIGRSINTATPAEKDDLKKINGIGPFIEEKLNELGIYTYEQLSQIDENMIPVLTAAIEFFPNRIDRDDWIGQADRLFYMKMTNPTSTTQRVVKSRTVVTRPNEENFLGEKKGVQEKIIVEATTPKIQRVVRREPIRRVERITHKGPIVKTESTTIKKETIEEKIEPPTPPTTEIPPKMEVEDEIFTASTIDELTVGIGERIEIITTNENAPYFQRLEEVTIEETTTTETITDEIEVPSIEEETVLDKMEDAIDAVVEEVIPDDLKKIEGIGPKISNILNEAGIHTFQQLADRTYEELQDIIDEAGPRYRIARPKTWPEQAALAAKGDWDALKALQDKLIGGVMPD